jgi:chemotaxis protein CheY-P-specific phosphatase CheC
MDPPRSRSVPAGDLPTALFPSDERIAAVFVELKGAVRGIAGLMIPASAVADLLRPLVGNDSAEAIDTRARSAFGELGNIALCAAAGAIATLAGGVALPTVPRVGVDVVGSVLAEAVPPELRELPAYLVETQLSGREEPLRIRFVWVPFPAEE